MGNRPAGRASGSGPKHPFDLKAPRNEDGDAVRFGGEVLGVLIDPGAEAGRAHLEGHGVTVAR